MPNLEDDDLETSTALVPAPDGSDNAPPVPSGTVPVVPSLSRLDELVQQYQMFATKSAQATLDLAETVVIAESELNKTDFQEFCRRVGLDRKGSKFRKMRIVGRKMTRFKPLTERLPPCWTTLVKMATLQPDEFGRLASDKSFGPTMTAAEVDKAIGRVGRQSTRRHAELPARYGIADFSHLDISTSRQARDELIAVADRWGIKWRFCSELEENLDHQLFHERAR